MPAKSDQQFGMFVKNNLLDPKHFEAMGNAVWLYLWLMDRVTHIDKKTGLGIVLGGKPFKFDEYTLTPLTTTRRQLKRLIDNGYIVTTRTPYGQVLWVTKCVKIFGNR